MAEYNGRRAPNFSQYLDDLNAIPSPYDVAMQQQQQQQQQQQDGFNLDNDLSLFTNTEFFDFDLNIPSFDQVDENNAPVSQKSDMEFLDMLGDGFGNVPDYAPQMNNQVPVQDAQYPSVQQPTRVPQNAVNSSSPASTVPSQPSVAASSPTNTASAAPGPKRKNTQKAPQPSVEEVARVAAEEDKRRRNTAASARFRVKKKMREQALEKTVKETTDKNTALEARVTALELENQWLKNLITEKNGKSAEEGKKAENNISLMFKKFLAAQKTEGERSNGNSKIGVGTF
ncbi:hypothetical protein BDV18DRAFT_133971 [Aspergillus unguis]